MAYPTTFAAAIRDPHVPLHWVLTLERNGVTYFFADADLTISGQHYRGALKVTSKPSQSIDPYTQRAAACTATVQLSPLPNEPGEANTTRPYDLSEILDTAWCGMAARLSLWSEGTTQLEFKVRLSGYASRPTLDGDTGVLTLYLEDWSVRRNRKFPLRRIEELEHPYSRVTDRGRGVAILIGEAVGLECSCYSNAALSGGADSYFVVARGVTTTNSYVLLDSTDITGSVTFATAINAAGETWTIFTVPSATAVTSAILNFYGIGEADVNGRFAGAPGTVITNPVAQIWYLACIYAGIPARMIDEAAFLEMRALYLNWETRIQIEPETDTSFLDVVREMSEVMIAAFFVEGDVYTGRTLDFSRTSVLHLRSGSNLLRLGTIYPDDDSVLATTATIRYRWGWSSKDEEPVFTASATRDHTVSTRFANMRGLLGDIDVELDVLECKYLISSAPAQYYLSNMELLHGERRRRGTIVGNREAHALRLYDAIEITHPRLPSRDGSGWSRERVIVTGLAWDRDEVEIEWLEA